MKHLLYVVSLWMVCFSCGKDVVQQKDDLAMPKHTLFKQVSPTVSGVAFANQVSPNDQLSISTYPYFYNGGGVAIGDIDNDDLPDLFLIANQGPNKLFRNSGDLTFEDISSQAGIEGNADWSTGVTMADVNADGWLDIYVSCMQGFQGVTGVNELFINQGDGTFREQAEEYGLALRGYGTQAAFFDYDHDGDLDCYVLQHAVHDANSYQSLALRGNVNKITGDKLLKNERGLYVDVTEAAGILQPVNGFGLGIAIADYNGDRWEDIYISNDFHEDDLFYINQGDGTFIESARAYFGHVSRYSMGSDAADFNNDGFIDLVTLDMTPPDEEIAKSTVGEDPNLVYHYKKSFGYIDQYNRNALQLNRSGKSFSDIGPLAGIMATDWSWSPLFADFDLDGKKDLFISNGILHRPNDLDFLDYIYDRLQAEHGVGEAVTPTSYIMELDKMPSGAYHNFYYKNSGDYQFEDQSMQAGFSEADQSNGVAYADLDNDGDLDLVCNRLNAPAAIFQNTTDAGHYLKIRLKGLAGNTFGVGATVETVSSGQRQLIQHMPTRGFMSSVDNVLVFGFSAGINMVDTVLVTWPSGKSESSVQVSLGQTLILKESDAAYEKSHKGLAERSLFQEMEFISHSHQENDFVDFSRDALVPFRTSTQGPALAVGDVNRDGIEDIFLGGANGQAATIWLQTVEGNFRELPQPVFVEDATYEDVDADFQDVDGDGDLDLYVVTGSNEFSFQADRLYLNNGGKGNFVKGKLPPTSENKSCVAAGDFDNDGDVDFFIGGRNIIGAYGLTPRSYLFANDGIGNFSDLTGQVGEELKFMGMVTDAEWSDLDDDGDLDLIVVGEWMDISVFENTDHGLVKRDITDQDLSGLWRCVTAADIDGDGDPDMVVGNMGVNTPLRKSPSGTLRLYVKDFDDNDKVEQILTYSRGDHFFPALLKKDELAKVLPSIVQKRFVHHRDFAGKTIDEIFLDDELAGAEVLSAQNLATMYLKNEGGFRFTMSSLPTEVQFSSVNDVLIRDFNDDDKPDMLLTNNYFGAHSYQGRYDAGHGMILLGDGQGVFTYLDAASSGLLINGEMRQVRSLVHQGNNALIIARNNQTPILLSSNTGEIL